MRPVAATTQIVNDVRTQRPRVILQKFSRVWSQIQHSLAAYCATRSR